MDILDNDVIRPLEALKVSDATFRLDGKSLCTDNWVIGKETEDQTRQRVQEDLEDSATKYADHAENTIMKLQQAYLKKNNPRQHAQSTDGSQRPEDALNRRISSRFSALFHARQVDLQGQDAVKSEEGIVCLTHAWIAEPAV